MAVVALALARRRSSASATSGNGVVARKRTTMSASSAITSTRKCALPHAGSRTVLPPQELADLARFARALAEVQEPARARLVGPDGSEIDVPDELYGVLRDAVEALSQGLAITIAPHNTMLTTQEAADLLNISRPTLVRLLTDGEIPHSLRGRHRRVLLRDILDYSERTRTERRRTLDQMAAEGMRYYLHPEQNNFNFFNDPAHPELSTVHRLDWFTENTDPSVVWFEPTQE